MSYTHFSYVLPLLCFIYLAWHALRTSGILKAQGLQVETPAAGH